MQIYKRVPYSDDDETDEEKKDFNQSVDFSGLFKKTAGNDKPFKPQDGPPKLQETGTVGSKFHFVCGYKPISDA